MSANKKKKYSILSLLKPYKGLLSLLLLLAILSNTLNLILPKIIEKAIDSFKSGHFQLKEISLWFLGVTFIILLFSYLQNMSQIYTSEKVARDLRRQLSDKLSLQTFRFIQKSDPNKLLTNLTSDIDAIKNFVAQAIVSIISSIILIIGASILLLSINWRLGLLVLLIIPIIAGTFGFVFNKVRHLFKQSQQVMDHLNKVISEAILGAPLIRVLNAQINEYDKFIVESGAAKNLGISIVRLFALLLPVIVFTANLGQLIVLALGGRFVIQGSMTLGEFAAFNSYIAILIFPILIIGFMSNIIARATASHDRIVGILTAEDSFTGGDYRHPLQGNIEVNNLSLSYGEKQVLKNISFSISPHTKTAIIGPTAAGKTQLLYALSTLVQPQEGTIYYDGVSLEQYQYDELMEQIGLVFQDAIIFNLSLRENIAFNKAVSEEDLQTAIETAALSDLIRQLPEGLDTIISERGGSLSGGQKQRIMLARALAGRPKLLFLDEFTARVDSTTEKEILSQLFKNYPDITLISITQSLAPIQGYDQIILLMEGELVQKGTHQELMDSSPEYIQIFESQKSINNYQKSTTD